MFECGDRLGDYEILGEPKAGASSQVFPARHVASGELAALKLLDEKWCWLPDAVSRFVNERRILSTLHHPHIITVRDGGTASSGAPYMVLDWLPCSLLQKLGGDPLAPQLALRGASQIAQAMSALHDQGMSHRELMPQHFLMAEEDLAHAVLKLADLGMHGERLDRDVYRAPEQWTHGDPIDSAADVYALGVLLFQMLAGRLPFIAAEHQELKYQHLFEAPPLMQLPRSARAQIADLLDAMLAKRAASRPQMRDVCAELLRLADAQ